MELYLRWVSRTREAARDDPCSRGAAKPQTPSPAEVEASNTLHERHSYVHPESSSIDCSLPPRRRPDPRSRQVLCPLVWDEEWYPKPIEGNLRLRDGWREDLDESGKVYFVDDATWTTTCFQDIKTMEQQFCKPLMKPEHLQNGCTARRTPRVDFPSSWVKHITPAIQLADDDTRSESWIDLRLKKGEWISVDDTYHVRLYMQSLSDEDRDPYFHRGQDHIPFPQMRDGSQIGDSQEARARYGWKGLKRRNSDVARIGDLPSQWEVLAPVFGSCPFDELARFIKHNTRNFSTASPDWLALDLQIQARNEKLPTGWKLRHMPYGRPYVWDEGIGDGRVDMGPTSEPWEPRFYQWTSESPVQPLGDHGRNEELPAGWELRHMPSGRPYFWDKRTETGTTSDPREARFQRRHTEVRLTAEGSFCVVLVDRDPHSSDWLTGLRRLQHINVHDGDVEDDSAPLFIPYYRYSELIADLRQIRLLVLSPGNSVDEITCHLEHVSLFNCPDYDTISYAWGTSYQRSKILIDGTQMSVPASSAAALRAARLTDAPRTLWIDAICINQSSRVERSQQVALMGEVYSNGGTNLIHLGNSSAAARELFDMYEIFDEAKAATQDFAELRTTVFDRKGRLRLSDEGFREATQVRWGTLSTLFDRQWFRRVWVVQEAALAKNNLCLYGNVAVPLLDILRTIVWIGYRYRYSIGINSRIINSGSLLWNFVDQEYGLYSRLNSQQGASATTCLYLARTLDVRDARDKVFGILGLMRLESLPRELVPNYEKSLQDVFRDATRYALQENWGYYADMVFNKISHRSHAEVKDRHWLSWVPRWYRIFDLPAGDASILQPIFNAHNGERMQVLDQGLETDPSHLTYRGVLVGQVEHLFPEHDGVFSIDDQETEPNFEEFRSWYQQVKTENNTTSSTLGTILLAGTNWQRNLVTERDAMAIINFERHILLRNEFPVWPSNLTDQHSYVEHQASGFWAALCSACRNRRLVEISRGLLALCPRVVQRTDIIAVLFGCQFPYLLRPWGSRFKLLGQCYVQGIMDGQAVQTHRAENQLDNQFMLC